MAVRRSSLLRRPPFRRKSSPLRIEPLEDRVLLAIFLVNLPTDENDVDPGDGVCDVDPAARGLECTLRAAILQANFSVGVPDEIQFNIGAGGPQTITPQIALPQITDTVSIDGTSQPPLVLGGSNFIELNGQNVAAASGLTIITLGSTVRGLVINRFGGSGITLQGGGNHTIVGNFIGTDGTGMAALPNTGDGISVFNSRTNVIGGANAGDGNLISGNNGNGIGIFGNGSMQNVIQSNRIGLNVAGNGPLPNVLNGVHVNGSPGNTVGGSTAQTRNVISANLESGVRLTGAAATGNVVLGNFIGTNTDGIPGLGNFGPGVFIQDASKTTIGGPQPTDRNVIAFNTGDGVFIADGATNRITQNVIDNNGGLGIDLAPDGPNFPQDADPGAGANTLQNFPELTPAARVGPATRVRSTLTSVPNTTFAVEFFSSNVANPSGFGEGQTFLATFNIPTDAAGVANIDELIPVQLPFGTVITATATDPNGNTSEFSNEVLVTPPDLSIDKNDSADPAIAGTAFTYQLTVTNNGPGDATGVTVTDTLPAGLTFDPATSSAACAATGQQVTCNVGPLAAGVMAMLNIDVQVASSIAHGTVLSNTATVGGNEPDFDVTNNDSIEDTTLNRQVDLRVAVTDNPDPVIAGSGANNLVYTVTVTNDGPSDASGVTVDLSNVLPAGVPFVSATGTGTNTLDGVGTDLWTIGSLARNAAANLTVTYTVGASAAHGALVSLTADNAMANEPLVNPGNDADTERTTINRSADLSIDKTDTPDPVLPGGTVTYTLTVQNAGPSDAAAVTVTDTLPAGVTFLSASPTPGCNQAGGVLTCDLGALAAATSTQVTIDVRTDPAATGVIKNQATVTSATSDPDPSDDMTMQDTTVSLLDVIVTEFTTTAADRGTLAIRYTIAGTPPPAVVFAFFASADSRFDPGDAARPPRIRVANPAALTVGDHLLTFDGGPYAGLINDPATQFVVTRGAAVDAAGNAVAEADLNNNDVDFLGVFHHGPFPAPLVIRGRDDTDRSNGLDLPADNADDVITIMGGATVTIRTSFSTVPIVFPSASVSEIRVLGLGGNDTITADATVRQPLSLRGGSADDMLTGGDGGDELLGGAGDDTTKGGLGDDIMDGGGGTDTSDFSLLPAGVTANLLTGTARGQGRDILIAIENLIGSAGRDRLTGNDAPNVLMGGAGNDLILGGGGDDAIDGQAGNDSIFGEAGNDKILGGLGKDFLCGGAGNDDLDGGADNDRLEGGDGDDVVAGGAGNDIICGGAGNDMLSGDAGNDSMDGGTGVDQLLGGFDFDSILFDLLDLPVDLGGIGKDGGKAVPA